MSTEHRFQELRAPAGMTRQQMAALWAVQNAGRAISPTQAWFELHDAGGNPPSQSALRNSLTTMTTRKAPLTYRHKSDGRWVYGITAEGQRVLREAVRV